MAAPIFWWKSSVSAAGTLGLLLGWRLSRSDSRLNVLEGPSGDCEDSLDVNDDGAVELSDAISVIAYQFSSGAQPPPPFEQCGVDQTDDTLGCEVGTCPLP